MRADSRALVADPSHAEIETIDGRRVAVRLVVNPRARRISVRICPTRREAIATAPTRRHLKRAVDFAAERAGWIASELARLPQGVSLLPGALAPLRGQMHELVYEHGRSPPRIESGERPRIVAPAPDTELFKARLMRFFKAEARADLELRVAAHGRTLGVKPVKIQVKELRSRWGSCTVEGVLSFSWRVVLAPNFVLDYLAAHEVAHLVHLNHSDKFWTLTRRLFRDTDKAEAWLNAYGAQLHQYGKPAGYEAVANQAAGD